MQSKASTRRKAIYTKGVKEGNSIDEEREREESRLPKSLERIEHYLDLNFLNTLQDAQRIAALFPPKRCQSLRSAESIRAKPYESHHVIPRVLAELFVRRWHHACSGRFAKSVQCLADAARGVANENRYPISNSNPPCYVAGWVFWRCGKSSSVSTRSSLCTASQVAFPLTHRQPPFRFDGRACYSEPMCGNRVARRAAASGASRRRSLYRARIATWDGKMMEEGRALPQPKFGVDDELRCVRRLVLRYRLC